MLINHSIIRFLSQWENVELEWYWKEMTKNGWSQPLDNIDE